MALMLVGVEVGASPKSLTLFFTALCRANHNISLYLACSLTCARQSAVACFNAAAVSASVAASVNVGMNAAPATRTTAAMPAEKAVVKQISQLVQSNSLSRSISKTRSTSCE